MRAYHTVLRKLYHAQKFQAYAGYRLIINTFITNVGYNFMWRIAWWLRYHAETYVQITTTVFAKNALWMGSVLAKRAPDPITGA